MALSSRSISSTILAAVFMLVGMSAAAEDAVAPAQSAVTAPAPVQLPPWMSADVLKAAVAINMTDEQKGLFSQIVGDYVTNHFHMITSVVNRGGANIDMTIRSKDTALVHTMDEKVHKLLTSEQLPAYEDYKKVLRAGLKP